MELLMEHLGNGFINMLLITMPLVLTAAAIGLVIGILQAVTSVQEQTIVAAPKILFVFLMIMILGGFFSKRMTDFLQESGNLAFNVVSKQGDFVLPANVSLGKDGKYHTMESPSTVDEIMRNPGKVPYAKHKENLDIKKTNPGNGSKPNLVESIKIQGQK